MATLIVVTGVAVEGAGAVIDMGLESPCFAPIQKDPNELRRGSRIFPAFSYDGGLRSGCGDHGFIQYRPGPAKDASAPLTNFMTSLAGPGLALWYGSFN